jgi:hypothetical protein
MKLIRLIAFITFVLTTETALSKGFSHYLKLADSDAPPSTVYMHFSVEYGLVLNNSSDTILQPGLGGTLSILIPDNLLNNRNINYFTFGIKGLNNPHKNMPYLSSMNIKGNKEIDDSFNFFQILAGYRFSERIREGGWYFEPRIGYILWDFHDNDFSNQAFVISPTIGYVYNNFDFAIISDTGFSQRPTNIGKNVFMTLGLSIGYDLGFYRRSKCHCEPYENW